MGWFFCPRILEFELIVYTKPSCVQCDATQRKLVELGIEFTPLPLADHPEGLELAMCNGVTSAPVVDAGDQVWGGYKPHLIAQYAPAMV